MDTFSFSLTKWILNYATKLYARMNGTTFSLAKWILNLDNIRFSLAEALSFSLTKWNLNGTGKTTTTITKIVFH